MANLQFIPNSSKSTGAVVLPLEEIPQEVKQDAEDVYKMLKTQPGRMRVNFESLGELNTYITQITSYCDQRPTELGGPIRFRKSPARKNSMPATAMEFRVTDVQTEAEQTAAEINTAVENVKTAAKK